MACGLEAGKCSAEDLKVARSLVPKALEPYVMGQWAVILYVLSLTICNFVLTQICFSFFPPQTRCVCVQHGNVKSFILQLVARHLSILYTNYLPHNVIN